MMVVTMLVYTKHKKTVLNFKRKSKSAQQRVTDFPIRKNGIIPRNDLLKAQLQVSKYSCP
jgi:hypothetical protein